MKKEGKFSESVTIRIEKKVLDKLRQYSESRHISLSTLTNQVLREYVNWHAHASQAGFISVRKALLNKLMDKIDEKEIAKIAKYVAKTTTKDIVLLLRNEYSLASALDVIETWVIISGYPHKHEVNDGLHHFVVEHDMGRKWSLYLSTLYRAVFEELSSKKPEFDITDNTLVFKIDAGK